MRAYSRGNLERVAADALRIVDAPGAAGGAVEGGQRQGDVGALGRACIVCD